MNGTCVCPQKLRSLKMLGCTAGIVGDDELVSLINHCPDMEVLHLELGDVSEIALNQMAVCSPHS